MTHAESQDLLLDLAYGELDPARAAELEGHLAGCAECQREKAALDEARRAAAPLRELEEPSAGFDERILAAARAQAKLSHGSTGQVIEVQGSVRPMELSAARIDTHAKLARPEARRRPRWALRVALGGSVAAAAALALVVSTTLQSKQAAERAAQLAAGEKTLAIHVQPAVPPAPAAAAEAARANEEARKQEAKEVAEPARADDGAARQAASNALLAKKARVAETGLAGKAIAQGVSGGAIASHGAAGSGGDALDAMKDKEAGGLKAQAGSPPAGSVAKGAPPAFAVSEPPKRAMKSEPAPPPAESDASRYEKAPAREKKVAGAAEAYEQPMLADGPAAAAPTALSAPKAAVAPATAPRPPDSRLQSASGLEQMAQETRHAGDYARAAAMYRRAAALRREAGDRGPEAAWDLAHAIECLAAAGEFDQARQVRAELGVLYPSEKMAVSAAGRALREVEAAPAPAPAKPAQPPAKAKSDDRNSATVPVEF